MRNAHAWTVSGTGDIESKSTGLPPTLLVALDMHWAPPKRPPQQSVPTGPDESGNGISEGLSTSSRTRLHVEQVGWNGSGGIMVALTSGWIRTTALLVAMLVVVASV